MSDHRPSPSSATPRARRAAIALLACTVALVHGGRASAQSNGSIFGVPLPQQPATPTPAPAPAPTPTPAQPLPPQPVAPNAEQMDKLKRVSGPYVTNQGKAITIWAFPDGTVRGGSDPDNNQDFEGFVTQLRADGKLTGGYNRFYDHAVVPDKREIAGGMSLPLTSGGRIIGSVDDAISKGGVTWIACPDPSNGTMKHVADGIWAKPVRIVTTGSTSMVLELDLLLAGLPRTFDIARYPVSLVDARLGGGKGSALADPATGAAMRGVQLDSCTSARVGVRFENTLPPSNLSTSVMVGRTEMPVNEVKRGTWPAGATPTPAPSPAPATPPAPLPPPAPPPPPAPVPPPAPTPTPPPVPVPVPSTSGQFRQLQQWDVRLEDVRVTRDSRLMVTMTVRNGLSRTNYFVGPFELVVSDQNGMTDSRMQPMTASSDVPARFPGTPQVEAGETLRVRYFFDITRGQHAPLATLKVKEGAKVTNFDLAGVAE